MITLRQLRYLNALARHRHFGRAADACAVSQPALSMQIKELEKDLGIVLVERRLERRGADAKPASRSRGAPSGILSEVTRPGGLRPASRRRAGAARCSFGVIPSMAPYVLPRLLPVLQERHPDLELELRETQTRFLVEELVRG